MGPDPSVFITDLQDANKKLFFLKRFPVYYFFKVRTCTSFSKIKSQKMSQNSRNQGFSYYICLMIEGSGSGRPKSKPEGPKASGSGGSGFGSATLPEIKAYVAPGAVPRLIQQSRKMGFAHGSFSRH